MATGGEIKRYATSRGFPAATLHREKRLVCLDKSPLFDLAFLRYGGLKICQKQKVKAPTAVITLSGLPSIG